MFSLEMHSTLMRSRVATRRAEDRASRSKSRLRGASLYMYSFLRGKGGNAQTELLERGNRSFGRVYH